MAAGKPKKYYYQPSLGVRTDFEKLLQRFSALGTVRYEKFAEIFSDMKLSLFCAGRQTQREAREYVEECFDIAVQFWLPPSSFLVRVGALYLLYGLYFFQLVSPRAKIRVTQDQWKMVTDFHNEAKEQQHLDLEYIFQKLQVHKAFNFVATPHELYPTFKEKETNHFIPDSLKEEKSAVDEIFSEGAINQLDLVHNQYQKMKVALNGEDASKPDASLDVIHSDLISAINRTLQTHRTRQRSTKYTKELVDYDMPLENAEDMEMDTRSSSVKKSLKRKAFSASLGYYKMRKKGPGQSSEDTAESADNDVMSPDRIPFKREYRGRPMAIELFEKDEVDSGPVQADMSEVFSMPDFDSIIPAKFKEAEKASEAASTSENLKETSFHIAQKKRKSRKGSATEAKTEHELDNNLNSDTEVKVEVRTTARRGRKKTFPKAETASGSSQPKKNFKTKISERKSVVSGGKRRGYIPFKKIAQLKAASERQSDLKAGKSETKFEKSAASKKKKIPSAQELLLQSLKRRRKQQRKTKKK